MKSRFLRALFCCAVLFLTSLFAQSAKAAQFTLDELGMTVSMPPSYVVFTRDIDEGNPNLALYGLTKNGLTSSMEAGNIYLDAWDEDVSHEITVTMGDSSLPDLSLFNDSSLDPVATYFNSKYQDLGITMTELEIYQHSQVNFLKMHISQEQEGATVHKIQYLTIRADKAINIAMTSYSGQFTASKEVLLKSVVDSAAFDPAPQTEEPNFTPTSAFTYTDSKTGVTFTVPENWVEKPLSKEREFIDVKFVSLEEGWMSIMYGSTDLWEEMTAAERNGYTRADIDNSFISNAYVAEAFGFTDDEVSPVEYGGNEYYTITLTPGTDVYGISLPVTMTHMMCVKNGFLHWFQFSGAKEDKLFGDFEALLSSAEFPPPESAAASITDSPDPNGLPTDDPAAKSPSAVQNITEPLSVERILLTLLFTIMMYSVPIVIYRYVVIRAPIERKKAKKITLAYGVSLFLLMAVIISSISVSATSGGAILLWSWVNYKVLTGGKDRSNTSPKGASEVHEPFVGEVAEEEQMPEGPEAEKAAAEAAEAAPAAVPTAEGPSAAPECFFCRKCGAQVPIDSTFCHKCGVKVYKGEE